MHFARYVISAMHRMDRLMGETNEGTITASMLRCYGAFCVY